jgi:hypothetical protein
MSALFFWGFFGRTLKSSRCEGDRWREQTNGFHFSNHKTQVRKSNKRTKDKTGYAASGNNASQNTAVRHRIPRIPTLEGKKPWEQTHKSDNNNTSRSPRDDCQRHTNEIG